MDPPAWAYNPNLARRNQQDSRSGPVGSPSSRSFSRLPHGGQAVLSSSSHQSRAHAPQSYTGPTVTIPRFPRNRQSLGRLDSGRVSSFQSNAGFLTASKSTYPSVHPSRSSALQPDDTVVRAGSSRTSAMSARSSAGRSHWQSVRTRLRLEPKADRFYFEDGEVVPVRDDSDDENMNPSDVHVAGERPQVGRKSTRQTALNDAQTVSSGRVSSRSPSHSPPAWTARDTEIIVISSDSENEDDKTEAEFYAVCSHIRLPMRFHKHGHLPFLRRNLRRSFLATCRALGISSEPRGSPKKPIQYIYRYRLTDFVTNTYNSSATPEWTEYRELVGSWRCAFCTFLGELSSEEMLRFHLKRDHEDLAKIEWIAEGAASGAKVTVTLLPPPEDPLPDEFSDDESEVNEVQASMEAASLLDSLSTSMPPRRGSTVPENNKREPLFFPEESSEPPDTEAGDSTTLDGTSATETAATSVEPSSFSARTSATPVPGFKLKHEYDLEHPILPPTNTPRLPRTGITADGKLLPPPKDDPYGPAAEPPLDSCRPGGARIYDLLNELSLEPFGVLAWSIVDREEEIYELEDVRDEDKVVLALWNRWIKLNRTEFVFNGYLNGVKAFLDEYYQMIHRAAGWTALRSFLIVLAGNRFLTLQNVLRCLAHYEKKVANDLVAAV